MGFSGYWWVLADLCGFEWVLAGLSTFEWVFYSFFCLFYWVLLGFRELYRAVTVGNVAPTREALGPATVSFSPVDSLLFSSEMTRKKEKCRVFFSVRDRDSSRRNFVSRFYFFGLFQIGFSIPFFFGRLTCRAKTHFIFWITA